MNNLPADLPPKTFRNPIITDNGSGDHGDPFVLRYFDEYFLYHTGNTAGRKGISVYRSKDLVDWKFEGFAVLPSDNEEDWNWTDVWAPEGVYADGEIILYVVATTKRKDRDQRDDEHWEGDLLKRRIGIARGTHPIGPFVWDEEPLISDFYNIDAHPFRDSDGKDYLFYATRDDSIRYTDGTLAMGINCERIENHDTLSGNPVRVTQPTEAWEGRENGNWYVNEGPFVVKRRGRYFALFSGGFYQEDGYGVGLAYADDLAGPWTKWPGNPIWGSKGKLLGPGHFALILAPDSATIYVVYHSYVMLDEAAAATPGRSHNLHWDHGRKILLDRFYWMGDRPLLEGPTSEPQPLPPQPVYDENVPFWRAEIWVRGEQLVVGTERFALNQPGSHRQLHLTQKENECHIGEWGGTLGSLPGVLLPEFSTDGSIDAVTLTSFYEDDGIHEMKAGDSLSWPWGGSGPLELNCAVKGNIEVTVGDDKRTFEGNSENFRLVLISDLTGADVVSIKAVSAATVTDFILYAR